MSKTMMIKPHTPRSVKLSLTIDSKDNKLFVANIEDFTDGQDFIQLIHAIRTIKENDQIHLFLNSNGGNAHACRALINAMKACKGKIITSIGIHAASCGAYTWSYGHELRMPKFSRLMFHGTSHMHSDKSGKIIEHAEALIKTTDMWLTEIVAKNILTEEEKNDILGNKRDVWLTQGILKERGVLDV